MVKFLVEGLTCEVCGRTVRRKRYYKFQGLTLILCESCAKRLNAEEVIVTPTVKLKQQRFSLTEQRKVGASRRGLEELEYEFEPNFGEIIRRARVRKGLELEKFAHMLGVSSSYLSKIEKGKVKPDLYLARRIERILNIRILRRIHMELLESVGSTYEDEVKPLTLGDVAIIEKVKKKKK